jgi:ribosomal protein S6
MLQFNKLNQIRMIYEINFLVLQSKTAELEKIRKETKKFIESYGAKIIEEKEYLKRKLAYEINHETYGFFTVLRFETKNGMNFDELKVKLNQKSDVARYIIVRADELPSLEEQDAKKLEKIHNDKKAIKSEDVEKALAEQKKAEVKKTEEEEKVSEKKPTTKEKTLEKETEDKKESGKEKVKEKSTDKKEEKTETKKEKKDKVSLDELDKKLDEILNS